MIETSLEDNEESPLKLQGYDVHLASVGRGKGIATLYKPDKFKHEGDLKRSNMQITKYSSNNLDVINVYRSSDGNSMELLGHLTEMLTPKKSVIITGDFNICFMSNGKNRMSRGLMEKEGFQQLTTNPTHIMGGHIDHVYWRDPNQHWKAPIVETYGPYHSDHDASCITLKRQVGSSFICIDFLTDFILF